MTVFDIETWRFADWLLAACMLFIAWMVYHKKPRSDHWVKKQPLRLAVILLFGSLTVLMMAWQPVNMVMDLGHTEQWQQMRTWMEWLSPLKYIMIVVSLWVVSLEFTGKQRLYAYGSIGLIYLAIGVLVHAVAYFGIWRYAG